MSGLGLPLSGVRVLCTLLLLCAAGSSLSAADSKPRHVTAVLLLAQTGLPDPDFADSLVLVMNNLGPAPIGLIVNRPTQIPVARLFPDLRRLGPRERVYFGGPIDLDAIWFLFRASTPPAHAIQAFEGVCISANRELLEQLLARDKPMDGLRIFIGHAGWAPGQLEEELAHGAWTLQRAERDAIFNGKSEHPWPSASQDPKRST